MALEEDVRRAVAAHASQPYYQTLIQLAANQMEFVGMIIEHLTEKGAMDPRLLYESPFTDVAPSGPEQVFSLEKTNALVAAIEQLNQSAFEQVA